MKKWRLIHWNSDNILTLPTGYSSILPLVLLTQRIEIDIGDHYGEQGFKTIAIFVARPSFRSRPAVSYQLLPAAILKQRLPFQFTQH